MLSESKLEVVEIKLRAGKERHVFFSYGERLADIVKVLSEKMGLLSSAPVVEKAAPAPKARRKRRTKAEIEAAKKASVEKKEVASEKAA